MCCGTGEQAYVHPIFPLLCRIYSAPVKSTPVIVKGVTSRVLTSGSEAGSGTGKGLPQSLLQTTQWRNNALMYSRAVGIQYVWRIAVNVLLVPAWKSLTWILWTMSDVNGCLGGSRYGNFAGWLAEALWILPPQWMNSALSKNRRSCLTSGKRLVVEGEDSRVDISFPYTCCWQSTSWLDTV